MALGGSLKRPLAHDPVAVAVLQLFGGALGENIGRGRPTRPGGSDLAVFLGGNVGAVLVLHKIDYIVFSERTRRVTVVKTCCLFQLLLARGVKSAHQLKAIPDRRDDGSKDEDFLKTEHIFVLADRSWSSRPGS